MPNGTKPLHVYLDIPEIQGTIPLTLTTTHIGKQTIRNSTAKGLDAAFLSPLSRIKQDPDTGQIVKEQFIITRNHGQFYIEDRHSTNGTFLNGMNLRDAIPQLLHNGSEIIVPVENSGKMTQLKIIFRFDKSSHDLSPTSQTLDPTFEEPDFAQSHPAPTPIDPTVQPSLDPTIQPQVEDSADSGRAQYFDPTKVPTRPSPVHAQQVSYDSQYLHSQLHDSTKSFIIIQEKVDLPPDAFDPQVCHRFGLDLSMFFRLDWNQVTHILIGYAILVLMAYRFYMNLMLATVIFTVGLNYFSLYMTDIFLTPIPSAFIFGLVFIVHEMSHVTVGKKQGFPSRFCLLSKGMRLSLLAAVIGFPIALPGAAVSLGLDAENNVSEMGNIKVAGPLSNLIFGWVCFGLGVLVNLPSAVLIRQVLIQSAIFNFSLGAFNMIPKEFGAFALDGKFIYSWKKGWYFVVLFGLIAGYVFGVLLI